MDRRMFETGYQTSVLEAKCDGKQQSRHNPSLMQQQTLNANNKQQLGLMELRSKPKEQVKLLSSKSLSMLVPRNFFFKKSTGDRKNSPSEQENEASSSLQTTRSFQSHFFPKQTVNSAPMEERGHLRRMVNSTHLNLKSTGNSELNATPVHLNAASSNTILATSNSTTSSVLPNLSPIVCSTGTGKIIDMSWSEGATSASINKSAPEMQEANIEPGKQGKKPESEVVETATDSKNSDNNNNGKRGGSRFRHFKSTGLVLRDVKNSLGLRIKAKQESKAFVKLINDTSAVTPTKLYSPFDIYTDTSAIKAAQTPVGSQKQKVSGQSAAPASRRKQRAVFGISLGGENGQTESQITLDSCTPKGRIVQQHKRHLMQAANSKFTFDSPAGRHCETVKDVERFQQCIEDISKAIQTRDRSKLAM